MTVGIIFAQLFLTTMDSIEAGLPTLALGFYLLRILAFIFNSNSGVNFLQSNMICFILAISGLSSLSSGGFGCISAIVLLLDAYLGAILFIHTHAQSMQKYLHSVDFGYTRVRTLPKSMENMDESFMRV